MSNFTEEEKKSAKKFIQALITVRNLPLLVLGLTTIAIVYPMAHNWALENIGDTFFARIVANIFTMVIYGAVDGLLELTLKFIDGTKPKRDNRGFFFMVVFVSCIALAGSGTFSIWSSPLIVAFADNSQDATNETKQLISKQLDKESKALENKNTTLENARKTEAARLSSARKKAEALEKEAAKTGHNSWYKDYKSAINNPRHWFWTCKGGQGCPKSYRDYRDRIIAARQEGREAIEREQNIVSVLSGSGNSPTDYTALALTQMVHTDSIMIAQNLALFDVKKNALILTESICLFFVILITIATQIGKHQYQIEIEGSFVTLFSAIEMGVMKIINVFFGIYKEFIDSINPQSIQNLVMIPLEFAGNAISGKARETREKLRIAEDEKKLWEEKTMRARQEAEQQRIALEKEKVLLQEALEKERRAKELELARKEREKTEEDARKALEKEQREREKLEREREKTLEKENAGSAQDKALDDDDARKRYKRVDKKIKDAILNAIRYQLNAIKPLDAVKDATKIAEHKAKINEILADKKNGVAFLESRGYAVSINYETGKITAPFKG